MATWLLVTGCFAGVSLASLVGYVVGHAFGFAQCEDVVRGAYRRGKQ